MDFGGRKEIFRTIVGSHNYSLNTGTSDKDYKVFVAPTFDDLYFNNQFSKSYIGQTEDFDCHDIRKVSSLWWKANVNFLEVLFSEECTINEKLSTETKSCVEKIFRHRDEIARMNLPYLYDACVGMHITKRKQIDKGTEGTQHLVDKFGYDTKQAMHSFRILDFLHRYAQTQFKDFKYAIKYNLTDNQDWYGKHLLSIKAGKLTREEYLVESEVQLKWIEDNFKHLYKEQKPNEEVNEYLLEIVKEIVKNEIFV